MVSIKLNLGLSYRKIHELRTQHEKAKPKREEEHKINVYYVHPFIRVPYTTLYQYKRANRVVAKFFSAKSRIIVISR
jgi:hypothetical protein